MSLRLHNPSRLSLPAQGWPAFVVLSACGFCAALGQAPWGLWPLALVAYAVALWTISQATSARGAFGRGWLFGTVHFALALHWIVEPFFVDAAATGWLAPFALVFLAAGLALFWGAAAAFGHWVTSPQPGLRPLALACALIGAEALRSTVFTGFPWALPGHTLIASPALLMAAWIGPLGLTAVVLVGAGLCATRRLIPFGAALWLAVVGAGALTPAAPLPMADAPVIRLVQPNAPQHLKWVPDQIPIFFRRALLATAAAPDGPPPALVIWPETSLPELLNRSETARGAIAAAAGTAPVLVGAQAFGEDALPRNLAALLMEGEVSATYEKHHLVPFGEYLPLAPLFDLIGVRGLAQQLAGGYRPGEGPATLDIPGVGRVFVMICYEAIFPSYIRTVERPRALVHLTNDAWFGDFAGPEQHLALARLRAVEQGLPLVRAANTGVSAVIDGRGVVTHRLPLNTSGGLDAALPATLPPTLYARTGDLPLLAGLLVAMALLYSRRRHIVS